MRSVKAPRIQARLTNTLDLKPIAWVHALLSGLLACGMLLSAAIDHASGGSGAQGFFAAAALTLVFALLMGISGRQTEIKRLDVRQAFLLTASLWLVMPALATLPFLLGGRELSLTQAVFEGVSGLTGTNATTLTGLDALPLGLLAWRALLHWLGGLGIVVLAVAVLPLLSIGGLQLFHTESAQRSEKVLPRAGTIAKRLMISYLVLTAACAIAYALCGMRGFDAVTLAMSTLSSGGMASSPHTQAIFGNPTVGYVTIVFMILTSLPFTLYGRALAGDFTRLFTHPEVRLFVVIVALFTLASFLQQSLQGIASGEGAFRGALFTVVSLLSSTGYGGVDYTHWGPLSDALFFVLMFLGGCTGSTAGGLKMLRLVIAGKALRQHVKRISFRNGLFPVRYGGASVSEDVVASVMTFLFLYFSTFLVLGTALNLMGLDLRTAFSAAISCLSNVGPGLGPVVGPAGTYAALPDPALWVLILAMVLGRLEIVTLLVLLLPRFWNR